MLRVQLAQEAETNRKLLSAQSAQQARATRIQRSVAMKMGNLHGTRALQVVFVAWRDHLLREKALGAKRAEAVAAADNAAAIEAELLKLSLASVSACCPTPPHHHLHLHLFLLLLYHRHHLHHRTPPKRRWRIESCARGTTGSAPPA